MPRVTMDISYPPAWCQTALYAGHRQVKTWVHSVVEGFLETGPGRFFPLLPLVWHRGTFQAIRTADCTTYGPHEVRGCISGPFGIYAGCYFIRADPRREEGFTLAHVPTGRKLATLDLAGACKRLAGELAPLAWGGTRRTRSASPARTRPRSTPSWRGTNGTRYRSGVMPMPESGAGGDHDPEGEPVPSPGTVAGRERAGGEVSRTRGAGFRERGRPLRCTGQGLNFAFRH
jgi:hypothetical protein